MVHQVANDNEHGNDNDIEFPSVTRFKKPP